MAQNPLLSHSVWPSWNPALQKLVDIGPPISDRLNPYAKDGVEIRPAYLYADAPNLKESPVYALFEKNVRNGNITPDTHVLCPSSGNTGLLGALFSKSLGVSFEVIMPIDAPGSKVNVIRALGYPVSVNLVASNTVTHAREQARKNSGWFVLDQYADSANIEGHEKYLAPQLFAAAGAIDVLVAPGGTLGTIGGLQSYAKAHGMATTFVVAVCAPGEEVPAGRDRKRIERDVSIASLNDFDAVVEGTRYEAFLAGHSLFSESPWRAAGPTGGLSLFAALKYVGEQIVPRRAMGSGEKRPIRVVFTCPDDYRPYADLYLSTLRFEEFGAKPPPEHVLLRNALEAAQ